MILAKHFNQDVAFVACSTLTTPDIIMNGKYWEIKSPTGNGKRTIQHQIHRALPQSNNIIFDSRKIKLRITKVRTDLRRHTQENRAIKGLILVEKSGAVTVIKEPY